MNKKLLISLANEDLLDQKRKILWDKIRNKTSYKFSRGFKTEREGMIPQTKRREKAKVKNYHARKSVMIIPEQADIFTDNSDMRLSEIFKNTRESENLAVKAESARIPDKAAVRSFRSHTSTRLIQPYEQMHKPFLNQRHRRVIEESNLMDPCKELDSVISNCENYLNN